MSELLNKIFAFVMLRIFSTRNDAACAVFAYIYSPLNYKTILDYTLIENLLTAAPDNFMSPAALHAVR